MKKYFLALLSLYGSHAHALVVHQSDWEAPFTPTYTVSFGNPQISAPTDVFDSNSLAFNTSGNAPTFYYDQIRYSLGQPGYDYPAFRLEFDMYTDAYMGSVNNFSVLFDTPAVRSVYFRSDGTIDLLVPGGGGYNLATFSDGEILHLDMLFDIAANQWDIELNNQLIYSGIIDSATAGSPAEYLRSIRFSYGLGNSLSDTDHLSTIYLDNVVVSAVPLPAAPVLFVSGLLGLYWRARRHK